MHASLFSHLIGYETNFFISISLVLVLILLYFYFDQFEFVFGKIFATKKTRNENIQFQLVLLPRKNRMFIWGLRKEEESKVMISDLIGGQQHWLSWKYAVQLV